MHRMIDSRTDAVKEKLRTVLGWVACAPRPLRWREIQGAICIDPDEETVKATKSLLEDPKSLFVSFVEIQHNNMVELVHHTAREYVTRS